MDKLDFAILNYMLDACDAKSKINSVALRALHSALEVKSNTLYRRLKILTKMGYTAKGFNDRREHTYYVTKEGEEILKEALK